jgi:hypothetical protein
MIWFGSSAGVALCNMFPEARSVGNWVRHGWHVTLAYVVGFAVLMLTLGWQPTPERGDLPADPRTLWIPSNSFKIALPADSHASVQDSGDGPIATDRQERGETYGHTDSHPQP